VYEGEVLDGKYRIERVLGVGGMGVVVAAWHVELEQRVAIKFLHSQTDARLEAGKRFRREARAAAKIRSEHVARVFDVGSLASGTPFIVMEFLDGNNLTHEMRDRRQLPLGEAIDYILQAIEALSEAHAFGMVHRDLKPANLFLARRPDGSRVIKVLDFGITKLGTDSVQEEEAITGAEVLIGSPQYMSPEQLSNTQNVDARSDMWSLGAILYKMLSGRPPYQGTSIPMLHAAVLRDTPAPLSSFRNDVPAALDAVMARCLAKNPDDRFGSVADLAQALTPWSSPMGRANAERAARVLSNTGVTPLSMMMTGVHTEVHSVPPSWVQRLLTRRILGATALAMTVLLVVLLGVAAQPRVSTLAAGPLGPVAESMRDQPVKPAKAAAQPAAATPVSETEMAAAAATVETGADAENTVDEPRSGKRASRRAWRRTGSAAATTAPVVSTPKPSDGITDFGGRR
jgi:serine/threonine-protein kinase